MGGACAAARIDLDLDLRAVRDRHGTDLVTRLRADLRRLAPDLLRWHMPRIAPDGRLRPGLTISLARYRSSGATPLQLVARTPPAWADAGQRMSLSLWEESGIGTPRHHPHPHPNRRFRLDLHRHLWDSGRCGELTWRCGAGGAPPGQPCEPARPHMPDLPDRSAVRDSLWASARWAAEAELLLGAESRPRGAFTVRLGARSRAVLELVAPDQGQLREELESAAAGRIDHGLFRSGLVAGYPATGAVGGGNSSGSEHPEPGHRLRLDRRTPAVLRLKRISRARPRTGLA